MDRLRQGLERSLEWIVVGLMASLALLVVVAVIFRKTGGALVWYDEVASVMLAWLTYYGAALAALRRAHIGVPTVFRALRGRARLALFWASEGLVIGFFAVVAWAGWRVLAVIGGTSLVSLPWVPARFAQSVIPIGAVLFIIAELLSIPGALTGPEDDEAGDGGHPEGAELT